MDFRLLGPVEASVGDEVIALGPPQQRLVLAVLLVEAGKVVSQSTLIDRVWDEAPAEARRTLHVHITRLRHLLGPSLSRRSGGYVLDIGPEQVDAHRFDALVRRARDLTLSDEDRAVLLRDALALWRGTPLAELSGQWAATVRERWHRLHLEGAIWWGRAECDAGRPCVVIGPLTQLLAENPLNEPLALELMRALATLGHGAEALETFATLRQHLIAELGVEPSEPLQALQRAVLLGKPPFATVSHHG